MIGKINREIVFMSASSSVSSAASASSVRDLGAKEPALKRIKIEGEFSLATVNVCHSILHQYLQMYHDEIQKGIAARAQVEASIRQAQGFFKAEEKSIAARITQLSLDVQECTRELEKLRLEKSAKNEALNKLLQQMPHCVGAQEAGAKAKQVLELTEALSKISLAITSKQTLLEETKAALQAQEKQLKEAERRKTESLEALSKQATHHQTMLDRLQSDFEVIQKDHAVFQFPQNVARVSPEGLPNSKDVQADISMDDASRAAGAVSQVAAPAIAASSSDYANAIGRPRDP